jgi:hypothetical protein
MNGWWLALLILTGCQSPDIKKFDDACDFLSQKTEWFSYAQEAESNWGVSSGLILAIIYQESSFKAEAGHQTKYLLGFIPWGRASSAYGFAQAKDAVWGEYISERGGILTERTRFKDASDFIGWYLNRISKQVGLKKTDGYNLYLAYHEGPTGYKNKTYRSKPWLLAVAKRVAKRAEEYDKQINDCHFSLKMKSLFFF